MLLGVLGIGATVAAVVVASTARTPAQQAANAQPPSPSLVTVEVAVGELVDETTLTAQLRRTSTTPVFGPSAVDGATKLVVTGTPVTAGGSVGAGSVVAEVSGRPVLLLSGTFGAYRDLTFGDTGPDVRQLQSGLRPLYGTAVTGTFDAATEQGVRKLYQQAGYQPVTREESPQAQMAAAAAQEPAQPTEDPATTASASPTPSPSPPVPAPAVQRVVVPAGEIAYVPELPAAVGEVLLQVGQDVAGPLLTLASGGWQAVAEVNPSTETELRALPLGATLRFGDGPAQGQPTTLLDIRDAPTTDPAEIGRREATFAAPGDIAATDGATQDVVIERARSPQHATIVPVSALWTATDGTVSVTIVDGSVLTVVPVTVLITVTGQAAVAPKSGELRPGDLVVVSYGSGPHG